MAQRLVFGSPEAIEVAEKDRQAKKARELLKEKYPDLDNFRERLDEINSLLTDYEIERAHINSEMDKLREEKRDIRKALEALGNLGYA